MAKDIKQNLKIYFLILIKIYEDCILVFKNLFLVQKTISKEWQNGSFYSKAERKSNFRIYIENLLWLLKNKEINSLYYAFSFDRKKDPVNQNEYISNLQFKRTRYRINQGRDFDYTCILRDKLLFHNFVRGFNLKTPRIIAVGNLKNIFLLESGEQISIQELLNKYQNHTFFFKDQTGECGKDVYKLEVNNSSVYINDAISSIDELSKVFLNIKNYIIQEKVEQHEELAKYHSTSVNTVRAITIKNKTGVNLFNAFLRIGLGSDVVDNVSAGGMLVGVDYNKGLTKEFSYKHSSQSKYVIDRGLRHNNSSIVFKDFNIPFFSEAVEGAKILHSFLDIQSIGWDIAITNDGPVYIEGNDNWEIMWLQLYDGGLRRNFYEIING